MLELPATSFVRCSRSPIPAGGLPSRRANDKSPNVPEELFDYYLQLIENQVAGAMIDPRTRPETFDFRALDGRPVTIWKARVVDGEVVPVEVQPDGGRRMAYDEFLRGLR